jgi:3-methyl-2-oxobutanoate hydroxymethyltransferase
VAFWYLPAEGLWLLLAVSVAHAALLAPIAPIADALTLQAAGAALLVLEAIPAPLGRAVTEALAIPTIGIGAGPDCSGQVLVMHDLLGVFPGRKARFVKNFMDGQTSIDDAVRAYVGAVRDGSFPAPEHCF